MLVFHFLPHEHVCPLLPDEANKNKTILVIAKNLRAVYRMVSENQVYMPSRGMNA